MITRRKTKLIEMNTGKWPNDQDIVSVAFPHQRLLMKCIESRNLSLIVGHNSELPMSIKDGASFVLMAIPHIW